ncbi:pentatricopeptide repeat-containing protein [Cinnamomum micranthum f. kanehirae]|uniref:Pentatricopeptide repeat-containing protein n=1 Tax=Cinnamomum micranthum f. kanehirae TaxID=337451 RepID=A0A443PA66_9MAGN|nr:pentatricopeptide repeat-containing protein [Cinnamomum micranthum f. kanehirae]
MTIRWPRFLTPTNLSQIIKTQKNPITALQIFHSAKTLYPQYRHNGPVYATMVQILAASNLLPQLKSLLHQMKSEPCQFKDSIFATSIKAFANAGLSTMPSPSTTPYPSTIASTGLIPLTPFSRFSLLRGGSRVLTTCLWKVPSGMSSCRPALSMR